MTRGELDNITDKLLGDGLEATQLADWRPPPPIVIVRTCNCGQRNRIEPGRPYATCGACGSRLGT